MLVFAADSFLSYINYRIKPLSSIEERRKKKEQPLPSECTSRDQNRSGDARLNGHPLILYTACRSLTLRQSSRFFSCAFPLPALQFRRVRCQFLPHAVPYRTYLPSGDSYALPALPVHSSPISPLPVSLFRSPSVSSHQGRSAFLSPKQMSV